MILWLLAVNRESGCVTVHSGRASARARVREQHPWGVGGNDAITPRVAHCEYIASTAQAGACRRHAGRAAGGAGRWPGPGLGPGLGLSLVGAGPARARCGKTPSP